MRRTSLFLLLILSARAFAVSPLLVVDNQLVPSPANPDSAAAQLAGGADNTVYICWLEPARAPNKSLRVARYDPAHHSWQSPHTIAKGTDLALDSASTPQIAVNARGTLAAAWYVQTDPQKDASTRALVSHSTDGGATWMDPQPLTTESRVNEFVSLAPLRDDLFLAVWLDPRNRRAAGAPQMLRSRILFPNTDDRLVDPRVCDCCSTALTTFPDGSVLALYRDRSDDEIRDISAVRFRDGVWSDPTPLSRDGWKIEGCPVNGPALASNGSHAAAAWFTRANGHAAVYATTSETAGQPFLMPTRIDDGKPLGHVAVVQLHDGTTFVSWVESSGEPSEAVVWLRRLSPDGTVSVPVRLAVTRQDQLSGIPRLALLSDADPASAQLLLAHTLVESGVPHVSTRLITVLAAEKDRNPCALCPPEDTRGSPVHGYIRTVNTGDGTARVKHDEIPGVMPAMTISFRLTKEDLAALAPEDEIFARIERRDDGWWLFSVKKVSPTRSTRTP